MSHFLSLWDAAQDNTPASTMEMAVVVPTLNEQGNMQALLDGILAADPRLHVIVVDDGSTDGTLEIVTGHPSPRVHLIARGRKKGFASALQDGMRLALAKGAQFVLQMDADFSHDPCYLPALLERSADCDLVLGSRYVRGGGTRHWPLHRQLLSCGGNLVARALLRLPSHDCTGGYRCWRGDALRQCGALDVDVEGYAFQFVNLYRCSRAGGRIGEVPIIFTERRYGHSKMDRRIVIESARMLLSLWRERLGLPSAIPRKAEKAPGPSMPLPVETPLAERRAA